MKHQHFDIGNHYVMFLWNETSVVLSNETDLSKQWEVKRMPKFSFWFYTNWKLSLWEWSSRWFPLVCEWLPWLLSFVAKAIFAADLLPLVSMSKYLFQSTCDGRHRPMHLQPIRSTKFWITPRLKNTNYLSPSETSFTVLYRKNINYSLALETSFSL